MASGIHIPEDVISCHLDLQKAHKYSTIMMRVNDKKTAVMVEEKFETQTYDELYELIKGKYSLVPLYIVHDMKENISGQEYARVIFIGWCSDDAPISKRMVFASSKDALMKQLSGLQEVFQATDFDDLQTIKTDTIKKMTK